MTNLGMRLATEAEWAVLGYAANAVWQVPLVFGAAWVAARWVRRSAAAVEHRVWVLGLFLEAGLPGCRLDLSRTWAWVAGFFQARSTAGDAAVRVALGGGGARGLERLQLPAGLLPGAAMMFVSIVIYCAVRLGWGVWRTETMRRRATTVVLGDEAARVWRRYEGTRRGTELRVSGMIAGPVTVGILRPAVLVPAGFLESVHNEDLEAVMAHELAHVRRWDFAKNLLYEAFSIAVAWHPAVWVTRARIAESREMVCDMLAAKAVAGDESYARSLLRLASMVVDGGPAKTLHAIGIFDANSFERRVMNLTKRRVELRFVQRMGIVAACAVVAVATCATALALRVEVGPQVQTVREMDRVGVQDADDTKEGVGSVKVEPGQMKSTNKTPPVYPAEAKAKKDTIDGSVLLSVTIGKDGSVEAIQVKKSLRADYDRSALDAVKTWQWEPFLLNGEPTEVETTVTVTYSLSK